MSDDVTVDPVSEESSPRFGISKMVMLLILLCGILLYGYTIYTVLSCMVYPASIKPFLELETNSTNDTKQEDFCWSQLSMDALLLLLFCAQHTLMAHPTVKALLVQVISPALLRPLYTVASCFAIQVLYSFWKTTPLFTLWSPAGLYVFNILLAGVQTISWVTIASSLFFIDYLELLGIKQFYYSLCEMGDPLRHKAEEQRRLLEHMRHPVFLGPTLILWAVPVMTYDRLLLAVMVPLYLVWGSHLDHLDVDYVKEQFAKKKREILSTDKME